MRSSSEPPEIDHVRSAHLVGIGGTAMTPLATILLEKHLAVSGSDVVDSAALDWLRARGATIAVGHRAENVGDVAVVIASSAVPTDNVELMAARDRGIPTMKHSAALGSLMRPRRGLAIAGTHGKTTTSALTSVVLETAGLDITYHVGGELLNYNRFGKFGRGDILVAEADEFDRRFLDYDPHIAVITSIEPDHLDYFGDFEQVIAAFQSFASRVRPDGAVIVCADDPIALQIDCGRAARVTYGFTESADWRLLEWSPANRSTSRLSLRGPDGTVQEFVVSLLGKHNATNACAVVALSAQLGLSMDQVRAGFETFQGTRRRFERIDEVAGIAICDDYAHHPTAIRAVLEAARAHYRSPIWTIFQPHTAHRTLSLWDAFRTCFADADHVLLVPTYRPAGREAEEDDPTIAALASAMDLPDAHAMPLTAAADVVVENAEPGDLLLVMGAGDVWTVEPRIIAGLRARYPDLSSAESGAPSSAKAGL
jgi:UDP-N-acetylmuramate--alanine ligase